MTKETGISWTEHTWNPWEGCRKVSPGCANCYMFQLLERYGRDPGTVRRTKTWRAVERWNEEARRAGRIDRVFTCSLSDFFHKDADAWRAEAWEVIRSCEHLHFQVLTKRPLLIRERLPADWGHGYANVWLGVSIENNDYVWRADVLRQISAHIRWISAEPLLGPLPDLDLTGFQWLVVGGESGPEHRNMDHAWARQLRDMAKARGVAFFFKQSSGARAGRGDLLGGREWKEYPDVSPAPQPPDRDVELARQAEELRQAEERQRGEEEAAREQERERQRQEGERLAAGQEIGQEREMGRQENERFQAELRWYQQEVESLRGELQRQREEAVLERVDLEHRLAVMQNKFLDASRAEKNWRIRTAEAQHQTARALKLYAELFRLTMLSGFTYPSSVAALRPSLHQNLAVLGLQWPTTQDAVKAAYRDLAKRHHPDRGGNAEDFNKVQAAYDHVIQALHESSVR